MGAELQLRSSSEVSAPHGSGVAAASYERLIKVVRYDPKKSWQRPPDQSSARSEAFHTAMLPELRSGMPLTVAYGALCAMACDPKITEFYEERAERFKPGGQYETHWAPSLQGDWGEDVRQLEQQRLDYMRTECGGWINPITRAAGLATTMEVLYGFKWQNQVAALGSTMLNAVEVFGISLGE